MNGGVNEGAVVDSCGADIADEEGDNPITAKTVYTVYTVYYLMYYVYCVLDCPQLGIVDHILYFWLGLVFVYFCLFFSLILHG